MPILAREPQTIRTDRYLFDRVLQTWELTPLRIALIYLVFGFVALYFSEVVLVQRYPEPLLSQLQAVKGGVEVVLTGGLIFGLTRAKAAQVERSRTKVEQQKEELLVLHRVLRHNLRNDLNVIMGTSDQFTDAALPDTVQRHGGIVRKTAEKMLRYTEQAARIRRVTAWDGRLIELDLSEEIPSLLAEQPNLDRDVEVRTELPESAPVRVNHMFLEAVEELITNAVEHNDIDDLRVEITVDRTAGPLHLVELRIADTGTGIPADVVDVLQRSETDQLNHLVGMGLWFVYWVVSESDGYLLIDEKEDGGALVRIRVPTASFVSRNSLGRALRADV